MNIKQKAGLAVGAAMIATAAGFSIAYAASGLAGEPQAHPTTRSDGRAARPDGGGTGRGEGKLASLLAAKLGVDQDSVSQAIRSVSPAGRPGSQPSAAAQSTGTEPPGGRTTPGAPPSPAPADRAATDEALARSIAQKLSLDEATVIKALQEVRSEQQASRSRGGYAPAAQPTVGPSR